MDETNYLLALIAVGGTLVGVFVAYLLQLRTLGRQQEFDRKRVAYERAVNSLKRIKDIAGYGVSLLKVDRVLDKLFDQALKADPTIDVSKAQERKELLLALVHEFFMVIGGAPPAQTPASKGVKADSSMAELIETARIGMELLRTAVRANENFEEALTSLRLTGDELGFADRLEGIRDRIVAHAGSAVEKLEDVKTVDWSWFDSDMQEILDEMRDDLVRTL